jgi:hypothetical protein
METHICNAKIPALRRWEAGRSQFKSTYKEIQKIRDLGCSLEVDHLPSKCKALGLTPSTRKKKKNKQKTSRTIPCFDVIEF